ncbi:MAG: hypothetical protein J5I90_14805 [Caldilineales bacterium]|nr:hypothetical protein [Caldilineales bacterium]
MPLSPRLRLHILPETLARSPGNISERFANPVNALNYFEALLQTLPQPLIANWLAKPGGHVILNNTRHQFAPGNDPERQLTDIAWTRLAFISDPIPFLVPTGHLIARLAGWGRKVGAVKNWDSFVGGVYRAFDAGFGLSPAARADVNEYLAEGIAAYLADRKELNRRDPALEKLLRAHLFDERAYRTICEG